MICLVNMREFVVLIDDLTYYIDTSINRNNVLLHFNAD